MQKEGFQSVMLTGSNQFKSQFERILPSSSVANLYPFSYSGKTDPDGMFIGRDVNGSNIISNFDRRSRDKTNGHILILGNTGEGKSYLLKLIITNFRQMGKKFFILDPDDEYKDLTLKLYLSGQGIPPDGQTANLYHKMALKSFIKEDKEVPDAVRESIIAKMFLQGNSYALGFGSVPDYDTAIQWYEKSIQNGNSDAALELAKLFESGQGVKMDLNRAHQLYETALQGFEKRYERLGSDKANIDMQSVLAYKIGRMYLEGQGVPGNAVQALSWLKKSAALNNSVAQYQVGKITR